MHTSAPNLTWATVIWFTWFAHCCHSLTHSASRHFHIVYSLWLTPSSILSICPFSSPFHFHHSTPWPYGLIHLCWGVKTTILTLFATGNNGFRSPENFKLSLPLRTNYLFGRVKKSLPEMYAFTVCMWLKSSSSPGIGTPFSYGVPGQANEIVLIEWGNNPIELLINDKVGQLLKWTEAVT